MRESVASMKEAILAVLCRCMARGPRTPVCELASVGQAVTAKASTRSADSSPAVANTLRDPLKHRRLPLSVVILAMALSLPGLWAGFGGDDLIHRSTLPSLSRPWALSSLQVFFEPGNSGRLMDLGISG